MTNKIILELPNNEEVIKNNVEFIHLTGENNTVKIKADSEEKFLETITQ